MEVNVTVIANNKYKTINSFLTVVFLARRSLIPKKHGNHRFHRLHRKKITVQHPHLTSPIDGEETFFPRPWWEGLGEGVNRYEKRYQ